VVDDSLQGNGTQDVTLRSDTERTPETVMLTEQDLGVFLGAFPTTDAPDVTGDGMLSLSHGDTITAEYIDVDDGSGGEFIPRIATADADCAAPVVSDVLVYNVTTSSVKISWMTDEPSSGSVQYGTTPPGDSTVEYPSTTNYHTVTLDDLASCTVYFFSITATDPLGNTVTDDNGGLYHKFTSGCPPPSPIPHGNAGTAQVQVERVSSGGTELLVHWDDQCSPWEANLIYGPLEQVAVHEITGAVCSVAQPAVWSALPPGNVWFVLVGENPLHLESSWGWTSKGERHGLGSSRQCGVTFKNTQGTCP
jgi:hypothetical protein